MRESIVGGQRTVALPRGGSELSVLLIGIDYFSDRGSGDKNFWYHLLPVITGRVGRLTVISFNYRERRVETQSTAGGSIQIFNVRPSHLGIDLTPDPSSAHNRDKCHSHFKSPPRSPLEYLLSFVRIRSLVRGLMRDNGVTNVHCMDNFGPAMHLLRRWVAPLPVSGSAMGYYARGPLHDRYLQLCYRGIDAIVPFSVAYREKLLELGLSEHRLAAIPWGIDPRLVAKPPALEERRELKRSLGIEHEGKLILWTGFIQQIRERELLASVEVAQNLVRRRDDVQFVFALKPECYDERYQRFAHPRVRLLSTTNQEFLRFLRAADCMLSPVTNTRSIITPPLTWIEAMAAGVPVITNKVPGVEAVILSGENGFVARSVLEIPALLDRALWRTDWEAMREKAREHVLSHFTVAGAATGYVALWRALCKRVDRNL